MLTLINRLFIIGKAADERKARGMLCGIAGVFLNVILCAGKLLAGTLTGAISITADAFNNLSDAASSIITLLGFKLAGQKPDSQHPFGHGRIEYIAGLLVSLAILLMGVELGMSSVEKIIAPESVVFSPLSAAILAASIAVKLYMARYNGDAGRELASPALSAASLDSVSDSVATAVVLGGMVFTHWTNINIDGWCGLAVAAFILFSGIKAARETISPLLGNPPEKDFVGKISSIVMAHPEIVGIHDLVVHDYGPGRVMITLHAEVPADGDLLALHDAVDNVEHELKRELGCDAVVHMDPIAAGDERTAEMKRRVEELATEIDPRITIHDFRMVTGPTHTNLIFDVVAPYDVKISDEELTREIELRVGRMDGPYFAVVQVDKSYVV